MKLDDHSSKIAYRKKSQSCPVDPMTRQLLNAMVLEAGGDDAGVAAIDCPSLQDQKARILSVFPKAKTMVSFVCRMNAPQTRSTDRSLGDGEFIAYEADASAYRDRIAFSKNDGPAAMVWPQGDKQK